jgi:hypothetical protein
MRTTLTLALALGCLVTSVGCTGVTARQAGAAYIGGSRVAVIPPQGILWTSIGAPLKTDATGKPQGSKVGTATARAIATPPIPGIAPSIPLVAWGDASEEAAMADGGISDVTGVDYEGRVFLLMYRSLTVKVHGN